jgi:hypothetical protein
LKTSWLYLIIGILLAAVVGFAVYSYREESKSGVELKMGEDGISIQEN